MGGVSWVLQQVSQQQLALSKLLLLYKVIFLSDTAMLCHESIEENESKHIFSKGVKAQHKYKQPLNMSRCHPLKKQKLGKIDFSAGNLGVRVIACVSSASFIFQHVPNVISIRLQKTNRKLEHGGEPRVESQGEAGRSLGQAAEIPR